MNRRFRQVLTITLLLTLHLEPATVFGAEQSAGPAEQAPPGHQAVAAMTVARVNGTAIFLPELMRSMRELTTLKYGKEKITPALARQIRQEAVNRLAVAELAYQRAVALGLTASPEETEAHIATLKRQFGSREHFQAYLSQKGLTEQDIHAQAERYLAVRQAIIREVDDKIQVGRRDINKAYEENKDQFVQPEKVTIDDVVFFLNADSKESLRQASTVLASIKNGLDSDLKRLQDGPAFHVRTDVDLKKTTDPSLHREATKLEPGGLSGVIVVDGTLHIIKLTEYRPRLEKSETEVRPLLEKQLRQGLRKKMLEDWKKGLLANATIEILDIAAH